MRIILFISLLLNFNAFFAQGISYYSGTLDNAIAIAMLDNKLIFINVYTDWCRPYDRMEETTLQDPELINLLNDNFINLKIDAEDENNQSLIKDLTIEGYPSFGFLNSKGDILLLELGFLSKEEFIEAIYKTLKFAGNESNEVALREWKEGKADKYFMKILAQRDNVINFPNRDVFVSEYFKSLSPEERREELEFFRINANFATTEILVFIVKNYEGPKGFFLSGEERDIQSQFVSYLKKRISILFDEAIRDNNAEDLKLLIESNSNFAEKSKRLFISAPLDAKKQNETYMLEYYGINDMKSEYASLAEKMVDRYILPTSPSKAIKLDESVDIAPNQEEVILFEKEPYIEKQITDPAVDSLENKKQKYRHSYTAARQLNEIATKLHYYFAGDVNNLRILSKATFWSSLSYQYFPLAEYYLTHAKLLQTMGETEKAIETLNAGYILGSPNSQVLTDIALFLSLIQEAEEEEKK